MTWFKLDDNFPRHPKVVRAGTDAAWLFVAGGCYCAQYLTDGLIPKCALTGLTALKQPAKLADRLVAAGLWTDRGDEYEVHDYLVYNPSRDHVEKERRKAQERRANGGRASHERRPTETRETGAPVPDPTRTSSNEDARPRATRIPEDFFVTEEMIEWVERECPGLDWKRHTQRFVNHWKSTSKNATKTDWRKTWDNWMLKEAG